MIDDRVLAIVKAVALGPVRGDDWGEYCALCGEPAESTYIMPEVLDIRHKANCEVTLARTILKEQGTSINIYKVEFDLHEKHIEKYILAITDIEAIAQYKDYKGQKNIRATLMREL